MSKSLSLILLVFMVYAFSLAPKNPGKQTQSGQTPGTVTFTFKTVTDNGTYSPKHVLAVWVEDANGFVKSRLVQAQQRKQYLYTWIASTSQNTVDATTGATLSSHQQRTVTWDCTDLSGNIVPDGDYTIRVEYTDKHAQGPLTAVSFTKGTTSVHLTPANATYFINMDLLYTPSIAVADFNMSETNACTNQAVSFTDNSTLATSWEWNFGVDAVPSSANTAGPHDVYYTTAGIKQVTLTLNGVSTSSIAKNIQIEDQSTSSFNYTTDFLTCNFQNASQHSLEWFWEFGDGQTSIEENPIHTYAGSGQYSVTLTSTNTICTDVSTQTISVSSIGIPENDETAFSLSPNPSTGLVNLHIPAELQESVRIKIYDVQGRLIHNEIHPSGNTNKQFNLESYGKGIYWFSISNDKKSFVKRLLID